MSASYCGKCGQMVFMCDNAYVLYSEPFIMLDDENETVICEDCYKQRGEKMKCPKCDSDETEEYPMDDVGFWECHTCYVEWITRWHEDKLRWEMNYEGEHRVARWSVEKEKWVW